MINWLHSEISTRTNEAVYPRDRIPFEIVGLKKGVLVLNWDSNDKEDRLWLKFAVLEFAYSERDDTGIMYTCVFHGEGPSGNLRECRHTYWGEDGYLFYPDGRLIAEAFKELSKYYDCLSD
jgi:hypothetical protein